jgi:hypothetical protein
MGHELAIAEQEKRRAELLREAARLLELVKNEGGRPVSREDERIVDLAAQAQQLEHEISQLAKDKDKKNAEHTSNRSSGEGGRLDNPSFMSVVELQELERLLSVLLQDKALIESLSLVEKQQLKGSRAIAHSLLVAQASRWMESASAKTPDEEQ